MFCPKCGNPVADGNCFCPRCGAAQNDLQPQAPAPTPKVKKKSKKGLIAGIIALCAVVMIAGVCVLLLSREPSGTQTVYQLMSCTRTTSDGQTEKFDYVYDQNGNPLFYSRYKGADQFLADYDEYGNITERIQLFFYDGYMTEYPYEYEYTYDDDDRIRSCREYAAGNQVALWEYTWDKKGNLIKISAHGDPEENMIHIWQHEWVYDAKGRLVTEYFCNDAVDMEGTRLYQLNRYDYEYDLRGNLKSVAHVVDSEFGYSMEDWDFSEGEYNGIGLSYVFDYDLAGRLVSVKSRNNGEVRKFSYDRDGNLKSPGKDAAFFYDEHGNLIRIEYASGETEEFEYKAVEMSREDARRYYRWEQNLSLSAALAHTIPDCLTMHQSKFYYYLIPNPIW